VINAIQAEFGVTDKRSLVAALPFLGDRKVQTTRSDSRSRSESQLLEEQGSVMSTSNQTYAGL